MEYSGKPMTTVALTGFSGTVSVYSHGSGGGIGEGWIQVYRWFQMTRRRWDLFVLIEVSRQSCLRSPCMESRTNGDAAILAVLYKDLLPGVLP